MERNGLGYRLSLGNNGHPEPAHANLKSETEQNCLICNHEKLGAIMQLKPQKLLQFFFLEKSSLFVMTVNLPKKQ